MSGNDPGKRVPPSIPQLYDELKFRNERVKDAESMRNRLWEQRRETLTELRSRGESLAAIGDFLGVHRTLIHRLTKKRQEKGE